MTQRLPDCDRCGHPANWHRLDDALNLDPTDPTVPFRCIGYDSEAPGPPPLTAPGCRCPAYVTRPESDRVIRFRQKPIVGGLYPLHAARFDGTRESVAAILEVARKADDNAAVATVPGLDVVVVRWTCVPDNHPAVVEYEIVERDKWLAFSERTDNIYSTDDRDLEQWYEPDRPSDELDTKDCGVTI